MDEKELIRIMEREIAASSTNSNFNKKIALSLVLIAKYCGELVDILSDYNRQQMSCSYRVLDPDKEINTLIERIMNDG